METGQPVGSRTLSRRLATPVSPATVRNVMADLEDVGLLYSPHVSAGRLPTQLGLRIYVDGLLELGRLTEDERASIEGKCRAAGRTVEEMLTETTEALSGLCGCAGLVLSPKADVPCRQVEFVSLNSGQALAVMVTESGLVENRVIEVPPGMTQSHLSRATNYLNARLAGRTLGELRNDIHAEIEDHRAQLDSLTARVVEAGIAEWSNGKREHGSLIVRGRANLIDDVTALADLERIRHLFDALDERSDFVRLLGKHRGSGRGPDLHRCGEHALRVHRMLHGRRSLPRLGRALHRGHRRDRLDPDQLRPHHPDGRSHRRGHRPRARLGGGMRRAGRQAGPAPGGAPKGTPSGTRETMHDETERAEPETTATAPTGQSDADAGTDAAEVEAEAESAAAAAAAAAAGAASASAETEAEDSSRQEDASDAAPDAASNDDGGDDDGGDEAASGEAALKDQLLRALADAENARRRARKDVEEARAYAISRFAEDLLSVADNLGRALESIPADRRDDDEAVKAIADGIEMTVRGFEAVMGRHGITKIDPLARSSTTTCTRRCSRSRRPTSRTAPSSRWHRRATGSATGCCARRWWAWPRPGSRARPYPPTTRSQGPLPQTGRTAPMARTCRRMTPHEPA